MKQNNQGAAESELERTKTTKTKSESSIEITNKRNNDGQLLLKVHEIVPLIS